MFLRKTTNKHSSLRGIGRKVRDDEARPIGSSVRKTVFDFTGLPACRSEGLRTPSE